MKRCYMRGPPGAAALAVRRRVDDLDRSSIDAEAASNTRFADTMPDLNRSADTSSEIVTYR